MTEVISLVISKAHARKLQKGMPFQMKHDHLVNGHPDGIEVELHMPRAEANRLRRNIRAGKGHRFKKVVGGAVSWRRDFVRPARKFLQSKSGKALTSAIGNKILKTANDAGVIDDEDEDNLRQIKGGKLSYRRDILRPARKFFNSSSGKALTRAVGNKALKQLSEAGVIDDEDEDNLRQIKGAGMKRLVKGSAEAKAHMAKLRAMRGKKGKGLQPAGLRGSGLYPSGKKGY